MNGAPKTGMLLGLTFEPMNPPHRPSTSLVGKLAGRECRIGSTLTAPTNPTYQKGDSRKGEKKKEKINDEQQAYTGHSETEACAPRFFLLCLTILCRMAS